MILNFLKKIPAGMMVVPLLSGSIITTVFPNIWEIGGLTAALFSSAGTNTLLGAQLFCMGTALQVKDMPAVLKRGGVLLIAKFLIGAGIGIAVGKIFGDAGFFGLSTLAIVSAVTNSNGSVYLTLMGNYGDKADAGCFPLLALNDGPFFTLVALGASGLGCGDHPCGAWYDHRQFGPWNEEYLCADGNGNYSVDRFCAWYRN